MKTTNSLLLSFLFCTITIPPLAAEAATVVDLTNLGNAGGEAGPNVYIYGQTFTAPSDNYLSHLDFLLSGGAPFRIVIAPWIPLPPAPTAPYRGQLGSALFVSEQYSLPNTPGYLEVGLDLPNLELVPGAQYAAVIDIGPYANVNSTLPAWITVAKVPPEDAYTGGLQVFGARLNGEIDGMTQLDQNFDAAFRVEFLNASEIPEPAASQLFLAGAWCIVITRFFSRAK